jgi:hypothetical protein
MPIMTRKQSLPQSRERGAHLLTSFQRFYCQSVNLSPLFTNRKTLINLVGRNNNHTVQVRQDQISRADSERLALLRRRKLNRHIHRTCSRKPIRTQRRRPSCKYLIQTSVLLKISQTQPTGNPNPLCSPTSLKFPSTTTPSAPKYFARVLIKPPQHAEYMPLGCETKTTLSRSMPSAKCLSVLGAVVLLAATMRTV